MNLEIAKEPIKNEKPYEIQLPYGCVKLRCDWPKNVPPRILRGAVIAELMRVSNNSLHIDFHNHGPDEAIEGRPAQVFYRTNGVQKPLYARIKRLCFEIYILTICY